MARATGTGVNRMSRVAALMTAAEGINGPDDQTGAAPRTDSRAAPPLEAGRGERCMTG